jgi:hypothetical protein
MTIDANRITEGDDDGTEVAVLRNVWFASGYL